MLLDTGAHWLADARRCESPNFDERPVGVPIDTIVIHNISLPPGKFGGCHVDELFCNQLNPDDDPYFLEIAHLRVSAHLLIGRDGRLTQYVGFDKRAWHAGVSHYRGRERCNDFSIGIELEGTDYDPYTDGQYRELAVVVGALLARYERLCSDRIVGHSDISPGRKTDPGPAFDWPRARRMIHAAASSVGDSRSGEAAS